MIRFVVWIFSFLVRLVPFWSRIAIYISGIWQFCKSILSKPAAWLFVSLYPVLEFLIELFTGHQGIVSTIMNSIITALFNIFLNYSFHINLQTVINQVPINIRNFCCYLGLNAALQSAWDGILSGMVIFINFEIIVLVFMIKKRLAWKFMSFTKM
jgi:hypothetical protein